LAPWSVQLGMPRRNRFPTVLALFLFIAAIAPRKALAERPPKPASAAVWETLGGIAGGVALGFAGGWIGASFSHCTDDDRTPWGACSDRLGKAFGGVLAGYTIGTPLGVWSIGKLLHQGGSGGAAAIGGFFGEVAGFTLVSRLDWSPNLQLPIILIVPAVVSTFAYHYFADPPEESETSLRIRETGARGAWAVAPALNGVSPRDRFQAELFSYRF
jgi:hypothetical protein